MRFYFNAPGEARGEGIEFPDAAMAMQEAAEAALAIMREQLPGAAQDHLCLLVHSDDGPVGSVNLRIAIRRAPD